MFEKLFGSSIKGKDESLSFHERRHRSRSAEPARKNRDSDIFNRRTGLCLDDTFASEYRKSFAGNAKAQAKRNESSMFGRANGQERPATAISFMQDNVDAPNSFSRSVTLDQIANADTKYKSIYGKKAGSNVLFTTEPTYTERQLNENSKKTEYKAKFKPFSTYVYLPGNGWLKPKQLISNVTSASPVGDQVDGECISKSAVEPLSSQCKQWFEEVAERNQKANQYRSRSQFGNPILGRQNLEQIYKQASGNTWSASKDARSLEQLQLMRSCTSSLLSPFEQHKQKLSQGAKSISRGPSSIQSSHSGRTPRRAQSMPPQNRANPNKTAAGASKPMPVVRPNANASPKVWIKPETVNANPTETNLDSLSSNATVVKSKNESNDLSNQFESNRSQSPPIFTNQPVRITDIKSPEELSGIKSPPPENWLISVDQQPIDWTNSNQQARNAANTSDYSNLMENFASGTPQSSSTNLPAADQPLLSGF